MCLLAGGLSAAPPNTLRGDPPRHPPEISGRRAAAEYRQRAYPLGFLPPGARARALAQTRQADALSPKPYGLSVSLWYNIGPAPITQSAYGGPAGLCSGRVAALAVDPLDPTNRWLIGAAQGGIWETSDGGASWTPRTDDQASLAMGVIAFAPSEPATVYAGTGEPNFRGDDYAGAGLLVSYNHGVNWQMLNTSFAETSFSSIQVNPTVSSNLVVATVRGGGGVSDAASGRNVPPTAPPRGIFVSSDGGLSFKQELTGEATALQANPGNFNQQYRRAG